MKMTAFSSGETLPSYTTKVNPFDATIPESPLNVVDYQVIARHKLPKAIYEYIASGTDDEHTLTDNVQAFQRWYLRPRVLRSVRNLSTTTSVLGIDMALPVFTSPAGVQGVAHPDGELATARACERMGMLMGVSQHATKTIEAVAAASSCPKWFQTYFLKDRIVTQRIVERAVRAGYKGKVLSLYAFIL